MKQYVIVAVTGYEGDLGEIIVTRFDDVQEAIYCVGVIGDDGVVELVDWGYMTPEDAREAWRDKFGAA